MVNDSLQRAKKGSSLPTCHDISADDLGNGGFGASGLLKPVVGIEIDVTHRINHAKAVKIDQRCKYIDNQNETDTHTRTHAHSHIRTHIHTYTHTHDLW